MSNKSITVSLAILLEAVGLRPSDENLLYQFFEKLLGGWVSWAGQCYHIIPMVRESIISQHPWLAELDRASATDSNLSELEQRFGKEFVVTAIDRVKGREILRLSKDKAGASIFRGLAKAEREHPELFKN